MDPCQEDRGKVESISWPSQGLLQSRNAMIISHEEEIRANFSLVPRIFSWNLKGVMLMICHMFKQRTCHLLWNSILE